MFRKKIGSIAMVSTLILTLFTANKVDANENIIKDHNLRIAINRELNKNEKYIPTKDDLKSLKKIVAIDSHIRDISGLEFAENLEILELSRNEIVDASPVKNLKKIKSLAITSQVAEVKKTGEIVDYPVRYRDGSILEPYDLGENATFENGKIKIKDLTKPTSIRFLSGDMSGTINLVDQVSKQTLINEKDVVTVTKIDGEKLEDSVESDQRLMKNPQKEAKKRAEKASKEEDSNIATYVIGAILLIGCAIMVYKIQGIKKK